MMFCVDSKTKFVRLSLYRRQERSYESCVLQYCFRFVRCIFSVPNRILLPVWLVHRPEAGIFCVYICMINRGLGAAQVFACVMCMFDHGAGRRTYGQPVKSQCIAAT